MSKVPLVVWSGGFDSTANIINLFSRKIPFETCYVHLPNNKLTQKRELKARKILLVKLTKIFGNYHLKDTEINFVKNVIGNTVDLPQPFIWGCSLIFELDLSSYKEIMFGYIKKDDFWHIRNEFESFIISSHKILRLNDNNINFSYPLEWLDKKHIIEKFFDYRDDIKELKALVQTCDQRDIKKNCKCGKCLEVKGLL